MYVTVTTLDFLDSCSPGAREIFAYWDRKRGDRKMPRRADIDPAEVRWLLPNILLVDVKRDPPGFVYRLVGTGEVHMRRADPTGKRVAEHSFGPSPELVLANYRSVAQSCSFLYDPNSFSAPDGRFIRDESLFMPLSEDGESVSQILVYSHYQFSDEPPRSA